MSRRPLVIALLALLALALLVPIVLQAVAGPDTPSTSASGEPPAADRPLEPGDVGWVFAAALFEGPVETYSLQAGTLGEPAPLLDLQVPFGVDVNTEPWRHPAVSSVVNGSVVYVTDDGTRSSVRRIAVAPDAAAEELAVLDEVVYSIAVTPDGRHAYLALADRADPHRELGIIRLGLDGLAQREQILDPGADAQSEPGIRLAAVAGFNVDIALSVDGRHLVRDACLGPPGCAQQVIDVESGVVTPLVNRRVMGVAGGMVLAQQCAAECVIELIDLASGAIDPVPAAAFDGTMALIDGEPRLVFVDATQEPEVLRAVDPGDGSTVDVFRAPPGSALTLSVVSPDVRVALPAGYLLVSVSGDDVGAIVDLRSVAVPLEGGQAVELPLPPFRPEFHGVEG